MNCPPDFVSAWDIDSVWRRATTAVLAYYLFGETRSADALAGMALAIASVALVVGASR